MVNFELIASTFLGSGAAFAVLTLGLEWYKHHRDRMDDADFLALELAFSLEAFASKCCDVVGDNKTASDSGGAAGRRIGGVPKAPTYPESSAYKLLEKSLLHDVLEFPHRRDLAQQATSFWWDVVGGGDCYRNAAIEHTLSIGARALDIAKSLRCSHKHPPRDFDYGDDWNLERYFAEEVAKIVKQRRLREARDRETEEAAFDVGRPDL